MKKKLGAFKNWLIVKLGGVTVEEMRGRLEWRDRLITDLRTSRASYRERLFALRERVRDTANKLSVI